MHNLKYLNALINNNTFVISSQLQKEFRAKLLKEIKPALSQADKLRDRSSQKFSRFSRGVQERRNKEKQTNSKLVADSTAAMHRACEKIQQQFERDIQKWSIDREERVSTGKQSFETGLNEINQRIKGDQDKNDISRTFLLSEKLQMYLSGKSEPMNIVNTSNTTDGLSAEKVTSIGCAHDASSTKPGISSVEAFQELLQFFKSDA